ncbi:MAG: hypothetical protein KY454_03830 [Actinobacteria bacterium]|nr:hypothetical protein [Actinomycetota bacterium]MBW3649554.1 hypothetical protein [Actinomycetota bacterium]
MSPTTRQTVAALAAVAVVLVVIAVLAITGNSRRGLRADILSARRAEPGAEIAITVSARDTRGVVTGVEVDFGDGTAPAKLSRGGCSGAAPGPSAESFDFTHRYDFQGVATVTAVVTSGCTDRRERVEVIRTIQIKPVRR